MPSIEAKSALQVALDFYLEQLTAARRCAEPFCSATVDLTAGTADDLHHVMCELAAAQRILEVTLADAYGSESLDETMAPSRPLIPGSSLIPALAH